MHRAPCMAVLSAGRTASLRPRPSLWVSRRLISLSDIEKRLPDNIKVDPFSKTDAQKTGAAKEGGLNALYGGRADAIMRGMLGPGGASEARESSALPIVGKATVEGTAFTLGRSTCFEGWRHTCADPVGWHLSKLGCATCKMGNDPNESVESIQLQIIKGCNVIEIDGSVTDVHQPISRAIHDTLEAFELDRDGFVFILRCGLIRQHPFPDEMTFVDASNSAAQRNRIVPIFERMKASSLPSAQLKTGFKLSELSNTQLEHLHLRRVDKLTAAGLSPDWIEAFFINATFNTKVECFDIFLIEGIHVLFEGRPLKEALEEVTQLFAYLEKQAGLGVIQYYGISSPHLAPPVKRTYPKLPDDALVPDQFKEPPREPEVINLYNLLMVAEKVGGKKHRFRFVQYPVNLTQHQAYSEPLPYDGSHTLQSLCTALGLTALGYSPLETTNLMRLPERYHNFPLDGDLKGLRMNFFALAERCVMKEMEVKDSIEKGPKSLPPLDHLFAASVFLFAQRQFTNLFFFSKWSSFYMMPRFRRAVTRFKEVSPPELKEWCKQYEQLVDDMFRLRRRMFEHKHGKKAALVNMAIDGVSPTLARCPILSQKAINFSAQCCDTLLCGFHVARYFHEATEMNPAKNGEMTIPEHEMLALCGTPSVSYADASPPHPYMLEPLVSDGKISKQRSKSADSQVIIDPKDPHFPDIPEEVTGGAEEGEGEGEGDEGATKGEEEEEGKEEDISTAHIKS